MPRTTISAPCVLANHVHDHVSHDDYFLYHDLASLQPFTCLATGTLVIRAWVYAPLSVEDVVMRKPAPRAAA